MLGLFNQEKLLPLRNRPIQIQLELVNSPTDAVSLEVAEGCSTGSAWDVSDIQCKCDLLALDNSLDDEYASHLLSGNHYQLFLIPRTIQTNRLVTIKN